MLEAQSGFILPSLAIISDSVVQNFSGNMFLKNYLDKLENCDVMYRPEDVGKAHRMAANV